LIVVRAVDNVVVLIRAKLAFLGRSGLETLLCTSVCIADLKCKSFFTDWNSMEIFDYFVANIA
jgi:hypothetical protein